MLITFQSIYLDKIRIITILMPFSFSIYRTALHIATENENIEVVKLLISHPNTDINIISILSFHLKYHFNLI